MDEITIIKISGLSTIVAPTLATLIILKIAKKDIYDLQNFTLSSLSIETDKNRLLKIAMYNNGFFGALMLFLYLSEFDQNLSIQIPLSFILIILFWISAFYLNPGEKYRLHTISSSILIIYLTILKFVIFFLFNDNFSLFFGIVDLMIFIASFIIYRKVNIWVEIVYGINLSAWVLFIFIL